MPSTFDPAELLSAMRQAMTIAGAEGLTTQEIAAQTPCTANAADRTIRKLCASGEMEYAGRKMVPNRAGVQQAIPAYRLKR